MSQIGNRFYVTALEDGTTLHGNLVSTGSLSQAWNGSAAIPDWTIPANQPTIYLTLLSGNQGVTPDSGGTWYYNGVAITGSDSLFVITTQTVGQLTMPALKIVGNLASSSNPDVDTITYEGSYTISGSPINFSCSAVIRISKLEEGSSLGVINFVGGISNITEKGQTITLYGKMYDPDGGEASTLYTKWWLNDFTTAGTNGASKTVDGTTYTNAFQVAEASVVDHALVMCKFYADSGYSDLKYTAYAAIDDMQDPEYMYITNGTTASNTANGNAASLRKDETAYFRVWVGTRDNPAVLTDGGTPVYSVLKFKLLDSTGAEYTATVTGCPTVSGGWRPLSGSTYYDNGVGKFSIPYASVKAAGSNMTGIVMAETASS